VEQLPLSWEPERRVYTVRSLTAELRGLLAERFGDIWVAGEISGAKLAASGHYYFTLKDQEAQLRAVCFRQVARYLKFKPQDGIQVLARGRIDVYEARGEYQLLVEALEPQGAGALQLAFEQLKKKLAAEGLFEAARKRPLPRIPRRIGIVTSPTGAVIRDLLNILGRRFPGLHIRLYPALVQGAGSIEQVVAGLEYFSRSGWPEVVIVARGGGSLEDLWTFNEEAVARAIAGCSVPVVSAIGHETDFTIADFVADLRAPTPSAAAEIVVPTRESLVEQLAARRAKLEQALRYRLSRAALRVEQQGVGRITAVIRRAIGRAMQRVDDLDERLRRFDPRVRLAAAHRRLDAAWAGAGRLIARRLALAGARLNEFDAHLRQLSPLAVLERGYALVERADGKLVRAAAEAPAGSDIGVRLARGRLVARVTTSTPD
jgi:exodeoxyribonuclease VII large subunit